jgi:hypothetical protein
VQTTRPEEIEYWDAARELIAIPAELRPCQSRAGACTWCEAELCDQCPTGCHTAGKLRPRNRLLRKTYLEEVPTTVWTAQYACEQCAAGAKRNSPTGMTENLTNGKADSALELIWRAMCNLVRPHR